MAIQIAVNTKLRMVVGKPMAATLLSFTIGWLVCFTYLLFRSSDWPSREAMRTVPWWGWLGGVLGVFYIWTSVIVSPRLGIAITFALIIAGQTAAAMIIDHYGLFGVQIRNISQERILGVLLVVSGGLVLAFAR